jgi:hypothetical protein
MSFEMRSPAIALVVLCLATLGACAGTHVSTSGSGGTSGGSGGPGSGNSGGGGGGGNTGNGGGGGGGVTGTGGSAGDVGTGAGGACQTATVIFQPKIPTVFVLVDRSGSEFDSATTGVYFTLRSAVLQVLQPLQGTVRFAFGAFAGGHQSPYTCNTFDTVPAALNNYDAIAAKYNTLGPLLPYGQKVDTPAVNAIPMVKSMLMADTTPGPKYMLFVTDSETDFCDDGNALCPADVVTWMIQDLYKAGIGTLVIGLPTSINQISPVVIQNFANAGADQPVVIPTKSGAMTATDVYNQCNGTGNGAWNTFLGNAGKTGMTSVATYGPTAGTALVYAPTSTSQTDLANQISQALADVKSCTFDLSMQTPPIQVDVTQLNQASVQIMGSTVPLDDTNGWHMIDSKTLELVGNACNQWRDPNVTQIMFNFPCQIIIPG